MAANYEKLAVEQFEATCSAIADRRAVIAAVRKMLASPNQQLSATKFGEIVGPNAQKLYKTPGINFFSLDEHGAVKFYAPYIKLYAETSSNFKRSFFFF